MYSTRGTSLARYIYHACAARSGAPKLSRASSTAISGKTTFTSFFFHNDQWNSQSNKPLPTSIRRHSQAIPAQSIAAVDVAGFRPTVALTPRRLLKVYMQLSKTRLTTLVVLTAMSGVALSPLPATVPVLLATTIGTTFCCASANTLNQIQEVPLDAQMARTRNRPLVRKAISPVHAAGFALVTGVAGPVILWTMVNPTTALLGAANIALYAGAYTYLKRTSISNTWVGAVVGAIPPMMGWTACGGQLLPSAEYPIHTFLPSFLASTPVDLTLVDNPLSVFALAMLLYSWQFPHFNSLAHLLRGSYAQAGYHMLSVLAPQKNALVSLRHAALLTGICSVLVPLSGLTTWTFALTSLVPNAIIGYAAWAFWKKGGEKQARSLWHHCLWYLPVVLGLMMFHKQGMDWTSWWKKTEEEQD
ncbi:protoheme IX farnesyltransferase [Panus rudis PR-1116 ss-1]|nr:protoheme IX farnesyltransferase [Panus rudis PR-1116 ss-1]